MAENLRMASEMEYLNATALAELRERGVDIKPFPDDVMQRLKTLTEQTLAEEAAADPKFAEVYQAYQAFREQDATWTEISEEAYLGVK